MLVYWSISQLLLLVFAYLYRAITSFNDHQELRDGNVAAGNDEPCRWPDALGRPCSHCHDVVFDARALVLLAGLSGGMTLVALALTMSFPLVYYSSLLIFLPIAVVGALVLVVMRFDVDFGLLPGDRLDVEIKRDRNWGAAIIEGSVSIGIAFVLHLYVPVPGPIETYDVCPVTDVVR